MSARRAGVAMCVLLSGPLLFGCGSASGPDPVPDTASTRAVTGAPTSRPATGMPPPADPSPVDPPTVAACDLLTPEQVQGFGLDPGTATPVDVGGPRQCSWTAEPGTSTTPPLSVLVGPATAGSQAVPPLPGGSVEQTEVEGYPASVVSAGGFCAVAVRTDSAVLVVSGGGTDCDATRAIARAAIGNLT